MNSEPFYPKPMKPTILLIIVFACLVACRGKSSLPDINETPKPLSVEYISESDTIIDFENSEIAQIPPGFTPTFTGKEQTREWRTSNDNGNKVIAQLAKNKGDYYNLLILEKPGYENFRMSVRVRSVSGKEDQGGGLVWRYMDNNNYYIARYNPLEKNFRFYRVVNGNRKQLKSEFSDIPSGVWFTLTIEMIGNKISCSINGSKIIEATDDTFTKPGRVGLWTKADAVTYFDDMTISPL